jgi:septum formation inhibitor MinC
MWWSSARCADWRTPAVSGDESARILAFSLRPPQLRIAGHIARAPEDGGRGAAAPAPGARNPEVARIENGEIQISPW